MAIGGPNINPIRKVNEWLTRALAFGASDIHIEPQAEGLRIRIRVDGELRVMEELPQSATAALISRVKLMSGIDINERRKPQDGRFSAGEYVSRAKGLDLRVNSNPTLHGEKIVLRLIDNTKLRFSLEEIGFSPHNLERYRHCINSPHGLVLHVGPTGSGKTTTLYSALMEINKPTKNVATVEDPVEYTVAGMCQTQVNHDVGLDFPSILRALLRQDPDIILIGEIRDMETAEIAIEAAMTGHLIFSTLHTNDAVGTISRLTDMGIPPFFTAYAINCIVSQRFVRKLCKECCEPDEDIHEAIKNHPLARGARFYRPGGCRRCQNSGFRGRCAIMEVLTNDERVQKAIYSKVPQRKLKEAAIKAGMIPLFDDAVLKAADGITSLSEVFRVAGDTLEKEEPLEDDDEPAAPIAQARAPAPAVRVASPQKQVKPPRPSNPNASASGPRRVVVRAPKKKT